MKRPSHGSGMVPCDDPCPSCEDGSACTRLHKQVGKLWTHQCLARHVWIVRNQAPAKPELAQAVLANVAGGKE